MSYILSMGVNAMIEVKTSPEMGRGIYAEKTISQGEVIMRCEILVLSKIDTPIVNLTDLSFYTFTFNEEQDCLVLGLGEIFNHDDQPNVEFGWWSSKVGTLWSFAP
jgi:hypothetical protein